jgi:hypothetical protein
MLYGHMHTVCLENGNGKVRKRGIQNMPLNAGDNTYSMLITKVPSSLCDSEVSSEEGLSKNCQPTSGLGCETASHKQLPENRRHLRSSATSCSPSGQR